MSGICPECGIARDSARLAPVSSPGPRPSLWEDGFLGVPWPLWTLGIGLVGVAFVLLPHAVAVGLAVVVLLGVVGFSSDWF